MRIDLGTHIPDSPASRSSLLPPHVLCQSSCSRAECGVRLVGSGTVASLEMLVICQGVPMRCSGESQTGWVCKGDGHLGRMEPNPCSL